MLEDGPQAFRVVQREDSLRVRLHPLVDGLNRQLRIFLQTDHTFQEGAVWQIHRLPILALLPAGVETEAFLHRVIAPAETIADDVAFGDFRHLGRAAVDKPVVPHRIVVVTVGVQVAHEDGAILQAQLPQLLGAEIVFGLLLVRSPGHQFQQLAVQEEALGVIR